MAHEGKTHDHGLPLPPDGQTPWGEDVREALRMIDARLGLVRAELWFIDNEVVTEISAANTPARIASAGIEVTGTTDVVEWSAEDGAVYTGDIDRALNVTLVALVEPVTNNQRFRTTLRKNGVTLPQFRGTIRTGSGGDLDQVTMVGLVPVSPGDGLTMWIENRTSSGNVVVRDLSVLVRE